jgi:hypothetical protein
MFFFFRGKEKNGRGGCSYANYYQCVTYVDQCVKITLLPFFGVEKKNENEFLIFYFAAAVAPNCNSPIEVKEKQFFNW